MNDIHVYIDQVAGSRNCSRFVNCSIWMLRRFRPNIIGIRMAIVAGTIPALTAANIPVDLSGSFFDA